MSDLTRVLDRHNRSLGRDMGWALKAGNTTESKADYAYDPATGRLASVADASSSFACGYVDHSQNLLQSITGPVHTVTNTFEANRDALLTKANRRNSDASDISSIGYTVNAIGQRTHATRTGAATNSTDWGYDSLGQVVQADDSENTSDRAYQYDAMGNRQKAADTLTLPGLDNYTANALNQYTSISHSGFLEIYGKAPVGQAITVNNLATTRQGTDFRRELGFDNFSGQRWETVTTNGGSPLTSHHHIPAASTSPVYDLDGNLTSDGQWTYTWDAENRLTSATRSPAAITAGAPYRMITYRYDSQSRQISRSVATTFGGPVTTTLYLYNGWNCIAEYTGTSLTRTYLWGLDLSGTPQGAGGVGGLLSISDIATATTHYPCYDGNGNVRKLLHATTLVPAATYDYGPFGELTRATGPYALSNLYRFSTKPQDKDTGLVYYNYRHYDTRTGRWPSRDPIGGNGGVNLYGFVGNDGVNKWDYLGFQAWMICNRCKGTQGPMNCITQDDDGNVSDPFTTNDPSLGKNKGHLESGTYDIRPKPVSSMERGNENLNMPDNWNGYRINGPGGDDFPIGTPSITGQFPNAIPGQVRPGGTTNYRIHGPGLSLGCITTGRCGDIRDMMNDNKEKGGLTLRISDVCCEKGSGPSAPSPRAIPVK